MDGDELGRRISEDPERRWRRRTIRRDQWVPTNSKRGSHLIVIVDDDIDASDMRPCGTGRSQADIDGVPTDSVLVGVTIPSNDQYPLELTLRSQSDGNERKKKLARSSSVRVAERILYYEGTDADVHDDLTQRLDALVAFMRKQQPLLVKYGQVVAQLAHADRELEPSALERCVQTQSKFARHERSLLSIFINVTAFLFRYWVLLEQRRNTFSVFDVFTIDLDEIDRLQRSTLQALSEAFRPAAVSKMDVGAVHRYARRHAALANRSLDVEWSSQCSPIDSDANTLSGGTRRGLFARIRRKSTGRGKEKSKSKQTQVVRRAAPKPWDGTMFCELGHNNEVARLFSKLRFTIPKSAEQGGGKDYLIQLMRGQLTYYCDTLDTVERQTRDVRQLISCLRRSGSQSGSRSGSAAACPQKQLVSASKAYFGKVTSELRGDAVSARFMAFVLRFQGVLRKLERDELLHWRDLNVVAAILDPSGVQASIRTVLGAAPVMSCRERSEFEERRRDSDARALEYDGRRRCMFQCSTAQYWIPGVGCGKSGDDFVQPGGRCGRTETDGDTVTQVFDWRHSSVSAPLQRLVESFLVSADERREEDGRVFVCQQHLTYLKTVGGASLVAALASAAVLAATAVGATAGAACFIGGTAAAAAQLNPKEQLLQKLEENGELARKSLNKSLSNFGIELAFDRADDGRGGDQHLLQSDGPDSSLDALFAEKCLPPSDALLDEPVWRDSVFCSMGYGNAMASLLSRFRFTALPPEGQRAMFALVQGTVSNQLCRVASEELEQSFESVERVVDCYLSAQDSGGGECTSLLTPKLETFLDSLAAETKDQGIVFDKTKAPPRVRERLLRRVVDLVNVIAKLDPESKRAGEPLTWSDFKILGRALKFKSVRRFLEDFAQWYGLTMFYDDRSIVP